MSITYGREQQRQRHEHLLPQKASSPTTYVSKSPSGGLNFQTSLCSLSPSPKKVTNSGKLIITVRE